MFVHRMHGAVDADGNIVAWEQVIVGQSFMKGTPFERRWSRTASTRPMVEGASDAALSDPEPAGRPLTCVEVGVPTLWWRSVGSHAHAYATETFLDKLARQRGKDPLEIRRKLLDKHPRHLGVLNLAAEKAGWGTPLPEGNARGIAVHE